MSSEVRIKLNSERLKLEFAVVGNPTVKGSDGEFEARKVVFTDYGDKANLKVSGVMRRGWDQPRATLFNVSGYPDKPEPPEWLDELFHQALAKYGKAKS